MARPIKETPVLKGKYAKIFLAEMEKNKNKKASSEELQRIKASAKKLMKIANFKL